MKYLSTHIDPFFLAIIGWIIMTLLPAIAMAQATISGNISGVKTGVTVIVGSNIWLESGQSGQDVIHSNKGSKAVIVAKTRTDARGNYSVNIASGSYIIVVWANGFTPESDTVNAPGSFSTVLLPTQRSSLHTSLTFDSNVTIQTSTTPPPAPPPPATPSLSGNIGGARDVTIILGNNIWFQTGESGEDIIHSNKGSKAVIVAKTKTGANGNYNINVAPGNYIIVVWANGFTPESNNVTVPGTYSTVLFPSDRSYLHRSLIFGPGITTGQPSGANSPANNPPSTNTKSSGNQTSSQVKGIWKRVSTEIYLEDKKVNSIPIGQVLTSTKNPNNGYIFSGGESNLTRTDYYQGKSNGQQITYHWTIPPAELAPKQEYSISCESIGNAGNGVLISTIVDYNQSSGSGIIASYRDGKKVGKLVPQEHAMNKGKIVVGLSSGTVVGVIEYWYIYEWQPNGTTVISQEGESKDSHENSSQTVNLALHKACKQSSTYFGTGIDQGANCGVDGRVEPNQDPRYMFHTNIENNPWWQVDLGKVSTLTNIKLHNRINAGERAKFIQVFISQDGNNWRKVYTHNGSVWEKLDINVNQQEARFVRVQLADRNYLHLFEVEVFGYSK